jgi:hypothetical protein
MRCHTVGFGILALLAVSMSSLTAVAAVMDYEIGSWPRTWPKELEPLRNNAHTYEVATALHEDVYEIRFRDRDAFERVWPILLGLKSKGGQLTLAKIESPASNQVVLFSNERPAVRILAPPAGTVVRSTSSGSVAMVFGPPWPDSALLPDGQLPEYVKMGDADGEKTWIPATLPRGNEVPFPGFMYRARIDMELVVDGKIIDLNRIQIPPDTPIIDKRWPAKESKDEALK